MRKYFIYLHRRREYRIATIWNQKTLLNWNSEGFQKQQIKDNKNWFIEFKFKEFEDSVENCKREKMRTNTDTRNKI